MLIGLIETSKGGHGFIRVLPTWERLFVAVADCDGQIPPAGARVECSRDDDDPRGPRARLVVCVADPPPDITRRCRACGDAFVITPGTAAWFTEFKGLQLPRRCPACREAGRRPTA